MVLALGAGGCDKWPAFLTRGNSFVDFVVFSYFCDIIYHKRKGENYAQYTCNDEKSAHHQCAGVYLHAGSDDDGY
uniref:Lipoprotein n=1 Tax=Prevotella sp. GTC17260 TaxID=3236796 RepID=A0AB33JGT3_9BACT